MWCRRVSTQPSQSPTWRAAIISEAVRQCDDRKSSNSSVDKAKRQWNRRDRRIDPLLHLRHPREGQIMVRAVGRRANHNLEWQEKSRHVWTVGPWQRSVSYLRSCGRQNWIDRTGPNDPSENLPWPRSGYSDAHRQLRHFSERRPITIQNYECIDRPAIEFCKEEMPLAQRQERMESSG